LLAIAQCLYAFNRFMATGLMMMKAFKPRYMLTVYLALCVVFSIAAMTTKGYSSVAMIILVLCFESVVFNTRRKGQSISQLTHSFLHSAALLQSFPLPSVVLGITPSVVVLCLSLQSLAAWCSLP
jgi:fucose permease